MPSAKPTPGASARRVALLLDTTVLIDALRGRSARDRLLGLRASASIPWVCAINIEEVMRGLWEREQGVAERLFDGLRIAGLSRREGERAGTWRRQFAARGVTLSQSDCLIAAAALTVDARLATGNPKHFPMTELEVEHWPAGV